MLLTTAGMQPFKPYFRGDEKPPHVRLTSCQKVFRTTDIENVGLTARHLTFFEMLGNFSFGDYFKQGAAEFAWELSTGGFGFDPERIWITVFGGDDELGLGPDEEAIACWHAIGVPDERIVRLGREDNFWQSGPTGPCGPCSELYLDRGLDFGREEDRPGDDTERFLEFWNLVFMQYELKPDGSLPPLPAQNIDTGLGLDRMAAILQDVPSVYETEHFLPYVRFGEELSGRSYGRDDDPAATRALRILADHGRGMAFLIADGVVPSNEDRGYILRRIMRRAIHQGRVLGIDEPFLVRLCDVVREVMGGAYPQLARGARHDREVGRGRGGGVRPHARSGREAARRDSDSDEKRGHLLGVRGGGVQAPRHLRLPLRADQGAAGRGGPGGRRPGLRGADGRGAQGRARRASAAGDGDHDRVTAFARTTGFETRFVGYEATEWETVIRALEHENGRLLAKLEESPFYAEGGGQVSDSGVVETESGRGVVVDVFRLGDDQAVALEAVEGELGEGQRARARRRPREPLRDDVQPHGDAPAARRRCGSGSARTSARPVPTSARTSCASTSPTASGCRSEELADVEDAVNAWIVENHPVRAVHTTPRGGGARWARWRSSARSTATGCGWWTSRASRASSAAARTSARPPRSASSTSRTRPRARRTCAAIEALTAEGGIEEFRRRTEEMRELAEMLRVPEHEVVNAVRRMQASLKEATQGTEARRSRPASRPSSWPDQAEEVGGVHVLRRWRTRRSRRRCSRCRTSCVRSSATARSCSARRPTGAFTWSRTSRRRSSSAG